MTKPRVYVETTIPSLYFDPRPAAETVARRECTRRWWATAPGQYQMLTSTAVRDELIGGDPARAAERLELVRALTDLPIGPAIEDIVGAYIDHKLMPADPGGDALHLAIASYHRCDYLVTWNCQHLANANKFGHIQRINAKLGLFVPALVTPLELLGEGDGTVPDG